MLLCPHNQLPTPRACKMDARFTTKGASCGCHHPSTLKPRLSMLPWNMSLTEDPTHHEVLTYTLPGNPECFSRYIKILENAEVAASRDHRVGDATGGTFFPHHQGDRQRSSVRLERLPASASMPSMAPTTTSASCATTSIAAASDLATVA